MAQAVGEEQLKQNKNLKCFGCGKELKRDHTGIVCVNSDHLCPDCSKNFVLQVIENPESKIPLKCTICKNQIIESSFERQLTQKQYDIFLMHNMKHNPTFLDENEIIVSCPFCPYWEINTADSGRLMFICGKERCKKTSCVWCKKEMKNKKNKRANVKVCQICTYIINLKL